MLFKTMIIAAALLSGGESVSSNNPINAEIATTERLLKLELDAAESWLSLARSATSIEDRAAWMHDYKGASERARKYAKELTDMRKVQTSPAAAEVLALLVGNGQVGKEYKEGLQGKAVHLGTGLAGYFRDLGGHAAPIAQDLSDSQAPEMKKAIEGMKAAVIAGDKAAFSAHAAKLRGNTSYCRGRLTNYAFDLGISKGAPQIEDLRNTTQAMETLIERAELLFLGGGSK